MEPREGGGLAKTRLAPLLVAPMETMVVGRFYGIYQIKADFIGIWSVLGSRSFDSSLISFSKTFKI